MYKTFIKTAIFLFFLTLFHFVLSANAATVTWTGGGTDALASNSANWSGNTVPQYGDDVVFDSTSKDCTWDITVTLASLTIASGYTGTVTLSSSADLTIAKVVTWTGGGTDTLASNPANWSGGVIPQNGDKVIFNDTSSNDCVWDINVSPALFSMNSQYTGTVQLNTDLSITGSLDVAGGILNLNNKNLGVDGDITIGANGSLYATSSTITIKGDWRNTGNFYSGTSTVVLNGINQTIYGNTTFYNLIKTVASADTLYFESGSTQTILNNLILQGLAGNLLSLRSTSDGIYWYIDPQGTRNISFVDIKDLSNISFTSIVVTNSVDSGHNNNVGFGGSECVCLSPLWQIRDWKGGYSGRDKDVNTSEGSII